MHTRNPSIPAYMPTSKQALEVILHENAWYVRVPKSAPDSRDTVIAVRTTP